MIFDSKYTPIPSAEGGFQVCDGDAAPKLLSDALAGGIPANATAALIGNTEPTEHISYSFYGDAAVTLPEMMRTGAGERILLPNRAMLDAMVVAENKFTCVQFFTGGQGGARCTSSRSDTIRCWQWMTASLNSRRCRSSPSR